MTAAPLVIGVDVGTQGVRVVAHDFAGNLIATASSAFPTDPESFEQDPAMWWRATKHCLRNLANSIDGYEPIALSVTSTSGTVVALDNHWQPVHPALMYRDPRSSAIAQQMREAMPDSAANSSWGLPKMIWFAAAYPAKAERVRAWRHATDYVIGRLTETWDQTDQTSALKSGYNPATGQWPEDVFTSVGFESSLLPAVGMTGDVVGNLAPSVSRDTGLPSSIGVTLGMTDGCSSQVAAAAVTPGAWNSTIGTTLVIKGTTTERVDDPLGRIYNHRHPEGWWMPGAASNIGAGWIAQDYPQASAQQLEKMAANVIPTGALAYPLRGTGERFPFISNHAHGFADDELSGELLFGASLEGVAYIERMGFDLIEELSGTSVDRVSTAGGGSAGETWMQIRANVLGKPIVRMKHSHAATGAAMIAASSFQFGTLSAAVEKMTLPDLIVEPDELQDHYQSEYLRFRDTLVERGIVGEDELP